jgi:sugar/nucleoside kinase (ribokinase family)
MASSTPTIFTSLGQTVLDDVYVSNELVAKNALGGGAIWSAIGARIFAKPNQEVALRIAGGEDFPASAEQELRGYGIALDLERRQGATSTRAELRYADSSLETRGVKFSGDLIRPDPSNLPNFMLASKVIHLDCAPEDVFGYVDNLNQYRSLDTSPSLIIYEPCPSTCVSEHVSHHLSSLLKAIKHVDVFSPNHIELLAFFGVKPGVPFDAGQIEDYARTCLVNGVGRHGEGLVVRTLNPFPTDICLFANNAFQVIRCAENGALIMSDWREEDPTWVPAYRTNTAPEDKSIDDSVPEPAQSSTTPTRHPSVVDTTGAGNAFLGGFAIGLWRTGDPIRAACYGAVSSSFVVQQIGLPKLILPGATPDTSGKSSSKAESEINKVAQEMRKDIREFYRKLDDFMGRFRFIGSETASLKKEAQGIRRGLRRGLEEGQEKWNGESAVKRLEVMYAKAGLEFDDLDDGMSLTVHEAVATWLGQWLLASSRDRQSVLGWRGA